MDNPAWFGQLKRRIILRNDVQYQSLRTKGSYTLKRNIAHLFDAYGKIVDLSSKLHSSEKKLHELNEEITNVKSINKERFEKLNQIDQENIKLRQQIDNWKKEKGSITTLLDEANNSNKALNQRIIELNIENEKLKAELEEHHLTQSQEHMYEEGQKKILRFDRCFKEHSAIIAVTSIESIGDICANASEDRIVKFWRLSDGIQTHQFSKFACTLRSLAFTADGRFFAVGVKGGAISIYNTSTAKLYSTLVSESADISSIVFTTPTGDLPPTLVTASSNGKLSVWDVAGGKEQIILDSQSECCGICASANATVCSAHKDGYIRVCDIRSKELIKELSAGSEGAAVTCMSVSEDGQLLLAVFSDGTVAVFDLSSFSEIRYWSIADLRPSHTFGSCCWIESSFFIGCQNGMIATGTLNDEQIKSVYLSELGDSSPVIHCAASSRKNKLVAATPDQISFWIVE